MIPSLADGSGSAGLPGVKLAGLIIGLALLLAAVRALFGRKR